MSYKALITDLDGTAVKLSSNGEDVSPATQEAVEQAQKQGYKIACATGRRWSFAKPVTTALGILGPCIVEGGTRIVDAKTDKTLWEKHLDVNALGAVLDIFQRESEGGMISTAQFLPVQLHSVSKVSDDARFMYLLGISPSAAQNICNTINGQGFAVAHMTPSWSGGDKLDVHVTHQEATKEHAIQVWQEMMQISKEQTIGMGDSGNDIPLFQSSGLKVAVGNGTPDLKRLADYIAPNQAGGALEHVITKFLIGN